MMTGSVAIWVPDGTITAEEMRDYARPVIEEARRKNVDTVILTLDEERTVTLTRQVLALPIFIESDDWRDAQEFAEVLSQRADRRKPN